MKRGKNRKTVIFVAVGVVVQSVNTMCTATKMLECINRNIVEHVKNDVISVDVHSSANKYG